MTSLNSTLRTQLTVLPSLAKRWEGTHSVTGITSSFEVPHFELFRSASSFQKALFDPPVIFDRDRTSRKIKTFFNPKKTVGFAAL